MVKCGNMRDNTFFLKRYAQFVSIPLFNTDGIKWPVRSGSIIGPVNDLFALEYTSQLSKLTSCYDVKDWGKAFPNSLSLWRFSHHVINGLEKAGLSKSEIARQIYKTLQIINALLGSNCCFEMGKHLILSNHEITNILSNPSIDDRSSKNLLLNLAALLWAYSDALYFQGREICCEYHGPYICAQNKTMLVREYKNFCPVDLWPELTFDTPYRHIRIVTFHDDSLGVFIDAYNNISVLNGSFLNSIIGGMLFIDGCLMDSSVADSLIAEFEKKLIVQTKYVNGLNPKTLYPKYLKLFWYRKKQLADYLNEPWTPPEKAFNILSSASIIQNQDNPYSRISQLDLEKKYDYSAYLEDF